MKLSTKYNRLNGIAIIIVVLIGSACYYYFISHAFNDQLNKDLRVEEREVLDFVKEYKKLPDVWSYKDVQREFVPAENAPIERRVSDVNEYSKSQHENISYRQLEFPVGMNGRPYKAIIRKSRVETEDLISLILISTLIMVVTLLILLFLVNHFFLQKLWRPFNNTLKQIKQFNLSGAHLVKFEETDINEFTDLNKSVSTMITRVNQDYHEVKSFTENASHEIQTPLAIINTKIELLSQSKTLNKEQSSLIQSIFEATSRLSKLNHSLILLTKIDNLQFSETGEVNLGEMLLNYLGNYDELIEAKEIVLSKNIPAKVIVVMNEALAEVLISNLITNAIKHNLKQGTIGVTLDSLKLVITNTGAELTGNPAELFERFKKSKVTSESLGLGLSIAMRICERYGFRISYEYENLMHTITVKFK